MYCPEDLWQLQQAAELKNKWIIKVIRRHQHYFFREKIVTEEPVSVCIGIVSIVYLNFQNVLMGLSTVSKEAKIL